MLFALLLWLGLYPKSGIVTEVNIPANTVTVTDANGNGWAFYGTEDYEVGDAVAMIMDSKGTETIYDDEIVTVRYERR